MMSVTGVVVYSSVSFGLQNMYLEAVEARHASFTPSVTSINGILGCANSVMKRLATKIALKWEKP